MDGFTESGAKRLASIIQSYWAKKGYDVACKVFEASMPLSAKSSNLVPLWCVRSDMVNGSPVRRAVQSAA